MEYDIGAEGKLIPVTESVSDSTGTDWEWGTFWRCVGPIAAASFTACATGCLPSGPLYPMCVAKCTGAWTLGGAVGCAIMQLMD